MTHTFNRRIIYVRTSDNIYISRKGKVMKKITAFEYAGCPYCVQGKKALADLIEENPEYGKVEVEWIEENEHPEIIANYDYYATPSMFIDGEKKYEAHLFESYEECRGHIKDVLDEALQ